MVTTMPSAATTPRRCAKGWCGRVAGAGKSHPPLTAGARCWLGLVLTGGARQVGGDVGAPRRIRARHARAPRHPRHRAAPGLSPRRVSAATPSGPRGHACPGSARRWGVGARAPPQLNATFSRQLERVLLADDLFLAALLAGRKEVRRPRPRPHTEIEHGPWGGRPRTHHSSSAAQREAAAPGVAVTGARGGLRFRRSSAARRWTVLWRLRGSGARAGGVGRCSAGRSEDESVLHARCRLPACVPRHSCCACGALRRPLHSCGAPRNCETPGCMIGAPSPDVVRPPRNFRGTAKHVRAFRQRIRFLPARAGPVCPLPSPAHRRARHPQRENE